MQQTARLAAPARQHFSLRWLALAAPVVLAALGLLWWIDPRELALPLCSFHHLTGWHCPGCGATRATHELLHGHMIAALHDNALWVVSLPLLAYVTASAALRSGRGLPPRCDLSKSPWFFLGVAAVAVVFGVLRNVPHYPFTLLVPSS